MKPKNPQFITPYKYVKSKKDKIYNAGIKAEVETEVKRVKREGRY